MQKDVGAKQLFDDDCNLLYTVAYGYNAYRGNDADANPVGIVSAYPPTVYLAYTGSPIRTAVRTSAMHQAYYRVDCPILIGS